jgi:hypothetical protein
VSRSRKPIVRELIPKRASGAGDEVGFSELFGGVGVQYRLQEIPTSSIVVTEQVRVEFDAVDAAALLGSVREFGVMVNCPGFDGGSPLAREERMGYEVQV